MTLGGMAGIWPEVVGEERWSGMCGAADFGARVIKTLEMAISIF